MNRYETPRSACSSTRRLRIAACTDTSSALGRLVAHDELGIAGERARDRDTLLEPSGELDRLLRERALGETDTVDELRNAALSLGAAHPGELAHRAHQDPTAPRGGG